MDEKWKCSECGGTTHNDDYDHDCIGNLRSENDSLKEDVGRLRERTEMKAKVKEVTGFVDKGDRLRLFITFENGKQEEIEPEFITELINAITEKFSRLFNVYSKMAHLQRRLKDPDNPPQREKESK